MYLIVDSQMPTMMESIPGTMPGALQVSHTGDRNPAAEAMYQQEATVRSQCETLMSQPMGQMPAA